MTGTNVLIRNAIKTPDGTILQSRSRHEYVTHVDSTNGNEYMVDGGLDYVRRSAHGDEVCMELYSSEPFEVQREVIVWGTYGKEGRDPLKYVAVAEMETEHLKKVLEIPTIRPHIRSCMEEELGFRKDVNENAV